MVRVSEDRVRPLPMSPTVVLLIGPSGAGKTTVGRALAERLGWAFEDADAYHSAEAVATMGRGEGLTDADRAPWLDRLADLVASRLADGPPTVLACSALRAVYRERLVRPGVSVVWLDVPRAVLAERLAGRADHFAGPGLLASQLAAFEPPADALRVDATEPVDAVVRQIERSLRSPS